MGTPIADRHHSPGPSAEKPTLGVREAMPARPDFEGTLVSARSPRAARISGLVATSALLSTALVTATPAFAVTGPEAAVDSHPYAARLTIGDETNFRACTGTLVDRFWILTAASCFSGTPGSPVSAGKPTLKTTATLSNGKTVDVTEVAPRSDRDTALVRLATPIADIKPAELAGSAPAPNTDLTAAGYGRTKTDWVPGKLRTGTFSVNSTDATTLTVTGKGTDAICKGDTGGPLLNQAGKQVGVHSRSWQGGCLGTAATETRTGAISTRVDDLADWVRQTRLSTATASIKNVNSNRCLFVPWQTAGNDAVVKQYDCAPQYADQQWKLEPAPGGNYQIRNVNSNRCLFVPWQTAGNDAVVKQYDCAPQYADQQWKLEPVPGGSNQIRNVNSNRCLWVPWQTAGNDAVIKQYDCDPRYADQLWTL
ncbi:trypsin-like serine protease [Streptomyces subrutilus]|uniref:trypsin-like serine protease n=1 Tax=Streptomyces subrutilus TaxID=36818 RepID=UPI0033CA3693